MTPDVSLDRIAPFDLPSDRTVMRARDIAARVAALPRDGRGRIVHASGIAGAMIAQAIGEDTAGQLVRVGGIEPCERLHLAQAPLIDRAAGVLGRSSRRILRVGVREKKCVEQSFLVEGEEERSLR